MESLNYQTKMIGLVTLYNPDVDIAAANIERYINELDALVVWDNSPLTSDLRARLEPLLGDSFNKVVWHGSGENTFIAPAINFTWQYAKEHGYDFIVIMDQDSQWEDFATYRHEIEEYWKNGKKWVYTPYVIGHDEWPVSTTLCFRRMFINSGTVVHTDILTAVDGADLSFPLDALDCDLSIRIQEANYKIACITSSVLYHTLGTPTKSEGLHLMTNNYNELRTYSITRGYLRLLRLHRKWLSGAEKRNIIKENIILRPIRILLLEHDKCKKLFMFAKGIRDGLLEKI